MGPTLEELKVSHVKAIERIAQQADRIKEMEKKNEEMLLALKRLKELHDSALANVHRLQQEREGLLNRVEAALLVINKDCA